MEDICDKNFFNFFKEKNISFKKDYNIDKFKINKEKENYFLFKERNINFSKNLVFKEHYIFNLEKNFFQEWNNKTPLETNNNLSFKNVDLKHEKDLKLNKNLKFLQLNKYTIITKRSKFDIVNVSFNEKQNQDYYRYWTTVKQKPLKNWSFNFENFLEKKSSKFNKSFVNNYKFINKARLLTTSTEITLPSAINIMVITNSYDVVHSWFIPGIGIKFDCVPGRSTHHHLFFEKPGMYYGQCAEICGRSHHHMPIKLLVIKLE